MPVVEALVARGDEVGEHIANPAIFLAGTSVSPDSADKKFLESHPEVPSVYVLDFWGNYRMRFTVASGALLVPTVFCVIDESAKRGAIAEGIPADHIVVTGNPYFEHFADRVTRAHEEKGRVLFISQPIRADAGAAYGFDEYQALEDVKSEIERLDGLELAIQLHPRDDVHKFDHYLGTTTALSTDPLDHALSRAGLVVGMFSPVLIQAAAAGKPVLSYQPGGTRDPLPTNRLGLTRKASGREQLREALAEYAAGTYQSAPVRVGDLWPKGATERIVNVIDRLI